MVIQIVNKEYLKYIRDRIKLVKREIRDLQEELEELYIIENNIKNELKKQEREKK